jgi:DNA gyrase/topoisomerase IV subunit A
VSSIVGQPRARVVDLTVPASLDAHLEPRFHVVCGLLDALERVEEVNKAIQFAPDRRSALVALRQEPFSYTYEQAQAILDMPMSWQCSETAQCLAEERNALAGRRSVLYEQSDLSLHWFG